MAAAVATAAAPPTDNRCVGGGGGEPQVMAIRSPTVPLPSSAIPALTSSTATRSSGRRRRGGDGLHPKASRRSTISSRSSSLSSSSTSSDDDDDEESVAAFGSHGVVVAKRLKDLQQHLVDLEDMELLDRHLTGANDVGLEPLGLQNGDADNGAGVMVAELRQKNKDLILAARLGKALLAKNDELSLMNERLAEEYGDKLEVRANTYL